MTAKGFVFGAIAELGDVDQGMTFEDVDTFGRSGDDGRSASGCETFDNWLNLVLDSKQWSAIEETYSGVDNVLYAFCRTLVGNRNNRMMRPPDRDDDDASASNSDDEEMDVDGDEDLEIQPHDPGNHHEELSDQEIDQASASSGDNRLFDPADMLGMTDGHLRACLQVAWGKRFAILDSGHLGLVPAHSVIGDTAVVLFGCSLPLIVREVTENVFGLIGESYFHGVADGELVGGKYGLQDFVFK